MFENIFQVLIVIHLRFMIKMNWRTVSWFVQAERLTDNRIYNIDLSTSNTETYMFPKRKKGRKKSYDRWFGLSSNLSAIIYVDIFLMGVFIAARRTWMSTYLKISYSLSIRFPLKLDKNFQHLHERPVLITNQPYTLPRYSNELTKIGPF